MFDQSITVVSQNYMRSLAFSLNNKATSTPSISLMLLIKPSISVLTACNSSSRLHSNLLQAQRPSAEKDKLLLDGYHPIEIKYPEAKDRGLHQGEDIIYDYMTEYLTAVKQTLTNKLTTGEKVTVRFRSEPVGFEDLVDVESLIDYNLLNEFMYNPDSIWKSCYMHKSINKVDPDTGDII